MAIGSAWGAAPRFGKLLTTGCLQSTGQTRYFDGSPRGRIMRSLNTKPPWSGSALRIAALAA